MPKLISICFTRYIAFNFFPPLIPSYTFGLPSLIYIQLLLPKKKKQNLVCNWNWHDQQPQPTWEAVAVYALQLNPFQ